MTIPIRILSRKSLMGVECYHLERLPKDKEILKETGYGRSEIWMVVKAQFFDKKLKFLKELTVADIEEIDGIWTSKTMKMVNEQKKHTTILSFSNISYNTGLDDNLFSQRRIQRGL